MEVRQLTSHPADVEAWATLIAVAFNRPVAEARVLWSWFNAHQSLLAWGAWDGATLAAQYSCLIRQLQLSNANACTVGLSTNMAVHPRYRGRGLIKLVAEPVYDTLRQLGALAGVGFSNAHGVKVDQRSKGYGYRVVGPLLSQIVWPHRVSAEPLRLSWDWPDLPATYGMAQSFSTQIRFEVSAAVLWQRYAAHPFRRYRFGALHVDGAAAGVVIDRPAKILGLRGASLLHASAASPIVLRELLARYVAALQQEHGHFVRVLATPRATGLPVLHQLGRVTNLRPCHPHYLTVKPLQPDAPPELFDLTCWDCLGGEVL